MSHDRRLSRLEHLLWEKLRAAEEGCADDLRVAAERRIVRGEAGPDDFQTMLASDLGRRQAGLVRDANSYYRDRVTRWVAPPLDPFDPYSPPPGPPPRPDTAAMSTRSFGLEILATPIHEPYPRRLYEELLRRAEGPRQTARFTDLPMKMSSELRARAAVVPPPEWNGDWRTANTLLALLGEDQGRLLRAQVSAEVAGCQMRSVALLTEIRSEILAGTADWSRLMVWFVQHKQRLQQEAFPLAVERWWARQAGTPMNYLSMRDHAAELLSYPPDEDPPWDLKVVLPAVRNELPGAHPESLREWIEAHKWRTVLEGDHGIRSRARVAELIRTSPVPATGGFLTPRGQLRDLG